MKQFKDFGITPVITGLVGDKIKIDRILNKEVTVEGFQIKDSKYEKGSGKCLYLQLIVENEKRVVFTASAILMDTIQKVPAENFPFATKIIKENERYQFT